MANRRRRRRRGSRRRRGFASWPIARKITTILAVVLIGVITSGVIYAANKYSKIETTKINADELSISDEIEASGLDGTGYMNIALFGVDTRADGSVDGTRSDTIIVASLNRETKEVKLASVYRDTLLEQSDGSYNKANSAYSTGIINEGAEGGPKEAMALLNRNLDMDIDHYVTVDFSALVDLIDALGGIEIDVQEEEVFYVNGYSEEIQKNTGIYSPDIGGPGPQLLNGTQATAYCRIRYTTGDDFRRTERQRDVITKVVEKLQTAKLSSLNKIIDSVFPKVSTNFTLPEILAYAKDIKSYQLGETTGFPDNKNFATLTGVGSSVIPVTLQSNVVTLHQFLFGDDGYTPSSTVTAISSTIENKVAGLSDSSTNESNYDSSESSSDYDSDYDSSSSYDSSNSTSDYDSSNSSSNDDSDYDSNNNSNSGSDYDEDEY
ncbi:MAG: LCP family protein [Hespellia sp.]|nr:LCP family protein [Hespellia sp.]